MSRTLRFGYDSAAPRIQSRIDRFVVRKHTSEAYDASIERAALDYARRVAYDVSPGQKRAPRPVGGIPAVPFGKRCYAAHGPHSDCPVHGDLPSR